MSKVALISSIVFCCLAFAGCANRNAKPQPAQVIHDTVYVEDKSDDVLRGTTVLKASEKNMESRAVNGLWLDSLISSPCQGPMLENPRPFEIIPKLVGDSTLLITANIEANCSYSFLGEIEVVKGNTLNLIYHGYGGFAECMCCFGLTYKIKLARDEDRKFNNLKYVTIDGYAKTALPPIR